MRRKDKARPEQEFMDEVLSTADDIHIGFSTTGAPYVIPLNFIYLHGKIYFHCAREGRKLDCIKTNAQVGFCTAIDISVLREEASTQYRSVSGTGKAYIVDDMEEKRSVLDALAKRFLANCEIPATDKMVNSTAVVRIEIAEMCGKQSPPPKK